MSGYRLLSMRQWVGAMADHREMPRRASDAKGYVLRSGLAAAFGAAAILVPGAARSANWNLYDKYTQSYTVGYATLGNPNLTLNQA